MTKLKHIIIICFCSTIFLSCGKQKQTEDIDNQNRESVYVSPPNEKASIINAIEIKDNETFDKLIADVDDIDELVEFQSEYDNYSLIGVSCKFNNEYALKKLLEKGANPLVAYSNDQYIFNALAIATEYSDPSIVKLLLEDSRIDINQPLTEEGVTPLVIACRTGRTDIVKLLLKKGANINGVDHSTNDISNLYPILTALEFNENLDIVELLLQHDARLDVQNYDGTVLEDFAKKDKKLEALIQKHRPSFVIPMASKEIDESCFFQLYETTWHAKSDKEHGSLRIYFSNPASAQVHFINTFGLNALTDCVDDNTFNLYFRFFVGSNPAPSYMDDGVNFSSDIPIAQITILPNQLEFVWYGFYNTETEERVHPENPFDPNQEKIVLTQWQ